MQLENGTYAAKPTGKVEVGDHKNGCLIAIIEFVMEDGQKISNTFWLTTKDGAINTRAIDTLKDVFNWDGNDPFTLVDHPDALVDIDVELVIENESFIGNDGNERTVPKIKWVNKSGSGAGAVKVENSDRKALMAKYGAKLRAVSGGTTPAKKAPAPTAAPSAPPATAKKKPAPPSDMDTCWKTYTKAMDGKPRPEVEAKWFEIIQSVHGEKSQEDYDPADWGAVLLAIKKQFDNLPF